MLKQLKLRKMIEMKKKDEEKFREKEEELLTREADLEKSLEECETEDDLNLVNEEIEKLEKEKNENDENKSKIEKEIADLEKELQDIEEKENKQDISEDDKEDDSERNIKKYKSERRKENMRRIGEGMTREERKAFVEREDVKKFLNNVKQVIETRSVNGVDLTIPEVVLDNIMDKLGNYSVLYNLVNLRPVSGKARATIVGEAPEAIWTEMIGKINELDFEISKVEVDGYKVGGFVPLDNSTIEDSLIDLSILVEELLAESIGIALDKAILYGKGTRMPKGIVTAINSDNNFKNTNIISLSAANTKLAKILEQFKYIKRGKRNRGPITVVMNESTWYGTIIPLALATNSNGAYVSALEGVFPGTGYKVEFCEQVPDDNMVIGDFKKYILAERKGKKVVSSTEAKFIEDLTLFKATARYDGTPVRNSAFIVIGLNGTKATTEVDFTPDSANSTEEDAVIVNNEQLGE